MDKQHEIVLAGTPQLRQPSKRIRSNDFHTHQLADLIDALSAKKKEENGVGIAAVQIGVPLRVIVYGFDKNPRYPNEREVPETVLINAEIIKASDTVVTGYEGCLSLPNVRGEVPRHDWIEIQALSHGGQLINKKITGFEARIVQHEIDHTLGVLFPEKMKDLRTLGVTEALKDAGMIP